MHRLGFTTIWLRFLSLLTAPAAAVGDVQWADQFGYPASAAANEDYGKRVAVTDDAGYRVYLNPDSTGYLRKYLTQDAMVWERTFGIG